MTLYFWKENDPEVGWLCQWYYCPFRDDVDESKIYKTAEHYMMHHKALLFGDTKTAAKILTTRSPRAVKALGRKVDGFDEEVWNAHREHIVKRGNILKFTRAITEEGFQMGTNDLGDLPPLRASLRELLLQTGDNDLVEASPFDRVWGIGFKKEDAKRNHQTWGDNLLGKALVAVREELKN